jgi:hypothetical protein
VTRITRFDPPTNPLPPGTPEMVTYEEAAEIIGGPRRPVSVRYVENLVAQKKLKRLGKNRARRIVYASLLAYISKEAV